MNERTSRLINSGPLCPANDKIIKGEIYNRDESINLDEV